MGAVIMGRRSAGVAPECPHAGVDRWCECIRGALEGWVPGMLGVHVHRPVSGPVEVARLVDAVPEAAELHTAAARGLRGRR